MDTKHTPGPWLAMQGYIVSKDCYGPFIAKTDLFSEVNDPKRRLGKREEKANARLIASLPDQFEALKQAYGALMALAADAGDTPEWNVGGFAHDATEAARKAIAKATGEKP